MALGDVVGAECETKWVFGNVAGICETKWSGGVEFWLGVRRFAIQSQFWGGLRNEVGSWRVENPPQVENLPHTELGAYWKFAVQGQFLKLCRWQRGFAIQSQFWGGLRNEVGSWRVENPPQVENLPHTELGAYWKFAVQSQFLKSVPIAAWFCGSKPILGGLRNDVGSWRVENVENLPHTELGAYWKFAIQSQFLKSVPMAAWFCGSKPILGGLRNEVGRLAG